MEKSKNKVQLGIYLVAILMMGVVGIASNLGTIAAHFPELSQTGVQGLMSVPCIVIMVVTLLMGKVMDLCSKKTLTIVAILLFLVGGIAPAFMESFTAILVLRGVFGVGVGMLQVLCTALVAENFEGAEREKVQGNLTAFQMIGCAIMVFGGGMLGGLGWNTGFYIHLIGVVSLIAAIVLIPNVQPVKAAPADNKPAEKASLGGKVWFWMFAGFFVFVVGQVFSNSNAFLVAEKGLGDASASGLGMAFFCAGGIVMGLLYGKVASIFGKFTMSFGFLVTALAYVVIALSGSIGAFYVGCVLYGLGLSTVMPQFFLAVGSSVPPAALGLALSIATCVQNFGQFCSPYVINPLTGIVGGMESVAAFWVAAVIAAVLAVVIGVISAAKKN